MDGKKALFNQLVLLGINAGLDGKQRRSTSYVQHDGYQ